MSAFPQSHEHWHHQSLSVGEGSWGRMGDGGDLVYISLHQSRVCVPITRGSILQYSTTPCLAGPQPEPRYRWRRPSLPILIHTVDCEIVGPGNYPKRISAQLQIFEVKFANIWNANFWHQNYYGPLLFTQRSKNKCLTKTIYLQKVCTFAKIAGEICKYWKTWFLVLQTLQTFIIHTVE